MLSQNPVSFERWLIIGVLRSFRFYRNVREHLCPVDEKTGRNRLDFVNQRYNQLYLAADYYWRLYEDNPVEGDLELELDQLELVIGDRAASGVMDEGTANELIDELRTRIYNTARPNPAFFQAVGGAPFRKWIDVRLARNTANEVIRENQLKVLTPEDLTRITAEMNKRRPMQESRAKLASIVSQGRNRFGRRASTGLRKLDWALGGGPGFGETLLVAGSNGSGKTVLANQLALEWAKQGFRVRMFTTEQIPADLVQRLVSNHLQIKFDQFVNRTDVPVNGAELAGYDLDVIPQWIREHPDLGPRLATMEAADGIFSRITFVDWARGENISVTGDFEKQMETLDLTEGPADAVIFDWIGSALDKGRDPDQLRHTYKEAIECLISHGKAKGRLMVAMAQVDKKMSAKQKYIKMIHLAECKAMTDNISSFVGVSSLDTEEKDSEGELMSVPQRVQYLNVDKARKGPKGGVAVIRKFEFQRFGDIDTKAKEP